MILIADSGSTKTQWCIADGPRAVCRIETGGANPFFQSPEQIASELRVRLLPRLDGYPVDRVFFYGAGCALPDKVKAVREAIASLLPGVQIEVGSDMLAAARALCGGEPGIACILGTGSNSCLYDGERIADNVSPLGFILGDEGSGAVLGRQFVGDCLKNQLPGGLKEKFLERYSLTPGVILEAVYRKPFPNRFLAGFSPFIAEHLDVPAVRVRVREAFVSFFLRNVMQYGGWDRMPVHFAGSVAWYYREVLAEAAGIAGIRIGRIVRGPLDGLVEFHSQTK